MEYKLNEEYGGTIIETGTLNNIRYDKFSSGLLIQRGIFPKEDFSTTSDFFSTVQNIKWYRSALKDIEFPITFNGDYEIFISTSTGLEGARFNIPRIAYKSSNIFSFQLIGVEPYTESSNGIKNLNSVEIMAIGKWK